MLRHAYLIMAYNQYKQLNYLLRMLDHPQNVIFVHIDKKSPPIDRDKLTEGVKFSRVYIYQKIKVYWGHYSQTECEVFLLEKALLEKCDYYHLLSGEDLPRRVGYVRGDRGADGPAFPGGNAGFLLRPGRQEHGGLPGPLAPGLGCGGPGRRNPELPGEIH